MRAASGPSIGMGHAMRARAVAQELDALGIQAHIVLDEPATAALLAADGFRAVAEQDDPLWADAPAEALWIDGPSDWTAPIASLRARGAMTVLVENRTPARELADWIVYPSLHHVDDAWDRAHAERVLAGADWIPLSREVRSARPRAERDVDLLVTFGGSDPKHLTERVLDALHGSPLRIAVAVGPHMEPRRAEIESAAAKPQRAFVLATGTPLSAWMARSRAAITALGTTLYELAHLGVPALILANYEEDRRALEWYAEHGAQVPVGLASEVTSAQIRRSVDGLLDPCAGPSLLRPFALGDGAARLAGLLSRTPLGSAVIG